MEENNEIFFVGGDVLVCLAEPMHKTYSAAFVWAIHLVRTYLMISFLTLLPQYAHVHILDDPAPFPQLRAYLMNGLFINQKTNKNIRISYSLEYKHSKKILYEKKNGSVGWNYHSGEQYQSKTQ